MNAFELKTMKKLKISYQEFILNDHRASEQMETVIQLRDIDSFYVQNGIADYSPAEKNTNLQSTSNASWEFEVYKMKKAILRNKDYFINKKITPKLTKYANHVFLLAMTCSRPDIVAYFLNSSILNVNHSIFGQPCWPSYFLLACTCSKEVFDLFKNQRFKYSIGWNSLTPYIIASYKQTALSRIGHLDFISYKQYQLFLKYTGVYIVDSTEHIPVFPLDFSLMIKNKPAIKKTLEEIPEAGMLSRLSFIVQREESFYLILSKYGFRTTQNFNGTSPLHFSCMLDDFHSMTLLCSIGFDIIKDSHGKWPYEYGSITAKEKTSVFFNVCSNIIEVDSNQAKKTFNYHNFSCKVLQWLDIFKFKPEEYEKYLALFSFIEFNRKNRILTSSRFNIISVVMMSKTPVKTDGYVTKMMKTLYTNRDYDIATSKQMYFMLFS